VLANKRLLLGLLFRTASETLLEFGKSRLGGQLGAVMVLHKVGPPTQPGINS
jgi:hypothetical protein